MSRDREAESRSQQHGNIFSRNSGKMWVYVQRESGLAHRTLVLRAWQVQALRVIASRWALIVFGVGVATWGYFAVQAARVPFLTARITHLEEDARRLDTLQQTLTELQTRYEQVQRMLSTPTLTAPRDNTNQK